MFKNIMNIILKGVLFIKNSLKLFIPAILIGSTTLSSFQGANAEENQVISPQASDANAENNYSLNLTESEANEIEQYVSQQNGQYILNETELETNTDFTNAEIEEIKVLIADTNSFLEQNDDIELDENGSYTASYSDQEMLNSLEAQGYEVNSDIATTAQSGGVNTIEVRWYGYDVYLSNDVATAVVNAGATGGATYLGGVFSGVGAAAAAAMASSIISDYTASNMPENGIIIPMTYIGGPAASLFMGIRAQ